MSATTGRQSRREAMLLITPGVALLIGGFLFPAFQILAMAFVPTAEDAGIWSNFGRIFVDGYYLGVTERTLRLSVIITAITIVLGFPIAYIIARSGPTLRLVLLILTVLPLMTSVVIRTFGWIIVLSRGGPLTDILHTAGLVGRNFSLLYTETGIVLAMVQVLLPFMAITTLGAIAAIDTRLEEAARTMGCGFWRSLWHVVLPLSIPGIVSGSLLVFALSISSFVTPSLVGGVRLPVLAWSIYQQATSTLDWHFAAAQSVFLLLLVMVIIIPYLALMRRKNG